MAKSSNGQPKMTPEQRKAFLEWFHRQQEDYFWCLNQLDICERYRGQVVVLHDRKILGSGIGGREAKEDALQRLEAQGAQLPPVSEILYVPIPEHLGFDQSLFSGLYPEDSPGTPVEPTPEGTS
jgi:hypothetical protein